MNKKTSSNTDIEYIDIEHIDIEHIDKTNQLNIHYLNINGLNLGKLQKIIKLLETNEAAIVILSETWFSCENTYILSPFFVASTTREDKRSTGHENGGIIIMANKEWRKRISLVQSSIFTIQFKVDSIQIACVYFPPRLSTNQIDENIQQLGYSDIILGDMNFRIGTLNKDSQYTNRSRFERISGIMSQWHLTRIPNSNNTCSRNDYVYSKIPLKWNYLSPLSWNLLSDHGIMEIEFPNMVRKQNTLGNTTRYSLKPLNNDIFCDLFNSTWDDQFGSTLSNLTESTRRYISTSSTWNRSDIQHIIDFCYDNLILAIKNIQSDLLIKYEPDTVRKDPYRLIGNTQIDAVRMFKMANRAQAAMNPIRAETSSSIEQETTEHLTKIFAPTSSTFKLNDKAFISSEHGIIFSEKGIYDSINKYSNTKAGGPDGIHIRILKVLIQSQSFLPIISSLFSLIADTTVTPKAWRQSILHPLLKDKNKPFIRHTRPINLTQILRRIFERQCFLAWRNDPWIQSHPMQAGFRNGYSTMTHLLLSDDLSRRGYPISVFLDIKAAYDSVDWGILHQKLIQVGCPSQKLNLVTSLMFQRASITPIVNKVPMNPIYSEQGLFQGSILSPSLFNVFINDLAIKCNLITPSLLFADDIMIKAKDTTDAQLALNSCSEWSLQNKMQFGILKCGTVSKLEITLYISHQPIPWLPEYKYLGVPHHWNRVSWEKLILSNCLKHEKSLIALSDHQNNWPNIARLAIWRTFIRPKLDYCLAIASCWWQYHIKDPTGFLTPCRQQLEQEYRSGLCFITASKRYSEIMTVVSGVESLPTRLQLLGAGLSLHLATMAKCNPLQKITPNLNTSKYYMFNCIFNHPTYLEFIRYRTKEIEKREHLPTRPGVVVNDFKNFKTDLKLKSLCLLQTKLRSYMILPLPDLPYRFDNAMLHPTFDAVKWRCGSLLTRSTCPQCLKTFNRAHIDRCNLLFDCTTFNDIRNSSCFVSARQSLLENFVATGGNCVDFHYTVIDYLLNTNNHQQLSVIFSALRLKLHPPSTVSSSNALVAQQVAQ